jgi:alginate O-acetyltransferase complex protein AlgI
MLFNSVEFALFLPLVFGVYWMLNGKLRIQNAWIVLSSYVFYGWWSWEFLGLIALSTAVDFLVGLRLDPNREAGPNKKKSQLQRKAWLGLSIAVNLGLLGYLQVRRVLCTELDRCLGQLGHRDARLYPENHLACRH